MYLSIYVSICLCVYLPVCLSIYLCIYLSMCLSACLSVYLLSVYLSSAYIFIHPSIHLFLRTERELSQQQTPTAME